MEVNPYIHYIVSVPFAYNITVGVVTKANASRVFIKIVVLINIKKSIKKYGVYVYLKYPHLFNEIIWYLFF